MTTTPKPRDRSQSVKRKEISPSKPEEQPSQKNPRTFKDDSSAGNTDENQSIDAENPMDISESFRVMQNDIEDMIKKYLAKATNAIMETLEKHSQNFQDIFMQNADMAI